MGQELIIVLVIIVYVGMGIVTAILCDPDPIEEDPEGAAFICIMSFFWFITLPLGILLDRWA